MAIPFEGEVIKTRVESWVEQKARPNFQHKSFEYFCMN